MTYWPLTNSYFPTNQTFHQFHDLDTDFDLHRITSGFHGAFATVVACQQGTLTLPDTWFRPPFWDLLMLQLLRPNSSNLPCLYSTFHLEYPLVLSRFCFSYAWTQGLLSVRTHASCLDWIMYGAKCFMAEAKDKASILHGSHVIWRFRNLVREVFCFSAQIQCSAKTMHLHSRRATDEWLCAQ